MVIIKGNNQSGREDYLFFCPGCGHDHVYIVQWPPGPKQEPKWGFNGDMVKPTFTPSLLNRFGSGKVCHLFVTNGQIQYCADSTHKLAGKTVEMAERFG